MVEYGWGGQVIDDNTWKPFERKYGPSLWGHERSWMSAEKQEESRQLCIEAAENGLRQPVQVIEGNYNLMPGVCPWWDSMKQAQGGLRPLERHTIGCPPSHVYASPGTCPSPSAERARSSTLMRASAAEKAARPLPARA